MTAGERFGRLDALINNAGISHLPGQGIDGQQPATADIEEVRTIFDTNFFGVINVTSAFLPLLRRSPAPRIVNVSSSAGSLAKLADLDDHNPIAIGYVPSKTAVIALTLQYAKGLSPQRILVNAVDPGFVATELTTSPATVPPRRALSRPPGWPPSRPADPPVHSPMTRARWPGNTPAACLSSPCSCLLA